MGVGGWGWGCVDWLQVCHRSVASAHYGRKGKEERREVQRGKVVRQPRIRDHEETTSAAEEGGHEEREEVLHQ